MEIVNKKHPDWKLEIWGDGPLKRKIQQQIEDAHLSNVVELKGYTYDIPSKLLEASLFVLSSDSEGFPMVLLEAMSCGLPVISSNCKYGPSEIITDGKDGYLVPMRDEKTMAAQINVLIENEDMRKKMGEVAFKTSQKYSVNNIIEQWISLFNSLIDKEKEQ